jgi:hypothetical protein
VAAGPCCRLSATSCLPAALAWAHSGAALSLAVTRSCEVRLHLKGIERVLQASVAYRRYAHDSVRL